MGALIVDFAKALAWPAAAIVLGVIFYPPLSRLFEGLGARATKLSLFKIGLELAAPASASSSPSLKGIKNPEIATVGDSTHMLFQQIQDERPATYAVIDIGDGDEWLTSRLFIGATMLQRVRGLECLVFVTCVGGVESKFVAVASVSELR